MAGFGIVIIFGGIGLAMLFALAVAVLIYVGCYLFESLAIQRYMKKKSISGAGRAFIPCYNKYMFGVIANNRRLGVVAAVVNCVKLVALAVLVVAPEGSVYYALIVFVIASLLGLIINTVIANAIFELFTGNKTIYTVLSVVSLGVLRTIIIFFVLNGDKVYIQNN